MVWPGGVRVRSLPDFKAPCVGGLQVGEEFRRQFAGDPESASADGDVTVEFVECLASCGSGPVVMIDEELHERVDVARARELAEQIKAEAAAHARM